MPSLVLPGEIMASRIGASLMSAAGAGTFVARDLEDYSQIATAAARPGQRGALLRYRDKMTAAVKQVDGPVASGPYTERLEGLYRLAWEVFRARRQPKDAPVVVGGPELEKLRAKAPPLLYVDTRRRGGVAREDRKMEIIEEEDE